MTKRQAIKAVSFFAIIIMIMAVSSYFLRDRTTTLSSYYSEPDNSINTIIVGSSHVNSTYIPAVLWQEYGIAAHNVFSWSQPMWISYHYIKEALKTQDIKVIVLEMYGMMYGNSYIMPKEIDDTNYKNSFSIDEGVNFYEMINTVKTCGIDLREPKDFLNISRYHSRWKEIDKDFFTYNAHKDHSNSGGYGYVLAQSAYDEPNYAEMANITQRRTPYETSVKYLDKIVKLARDKGIKLVFTMSPYVYKADEVDIFNWISDYASKENIPFLNYAQSAGEECKFEYASDLSDAGHTNFYGACKITGNLGKFLKENYQIPPVDISAAQHLDKDSAYMYRSFKVNEYFTINNINDYLDKISTDKNLRLYAVSNRINSSADNQRFVLQNSAFEKADLSKNILAAQLFADDKIINADLAEQLLYEVKESDINMQLYGDKLVCLSLTGKLNIKLDFAQNDFYIVAYDDILKKPLEIITINNDLTINHREIISKDYQK